MADHLVTLSVRVDSSAGVDGEEREDLTRHLREEILESGAHSAEPARGGELPQGAKGDPFTLGALVVTLAASGGVLTTLINSLQSFLTRRERASVTVELGGDKLSITGASSEQQSRLIEEFVNRHKGQ